MKIKDLPKKSLQESMLEQFDEHAVLHDLQHYLPAQAPLKDFVHHNTLHAFQTKHFHQGRFEAQHIFGYQVSMSLAEFRNMYNEQRIEKKVLMHIIQQYKGAEQTESWFEKMLFKTYNIEISPRIGVLRSHWKTDYRIDLDALVHSVLFRVLCSYLDQGISMWQFPISHKGFLASIRELERNSFVSLFKSKQAKDLLLQHQSCTITALLTKLVGDKNLFEQYLFDQQFAHQGWSGMVSAIENQPHTLLDKKKISLHDLIIFELLLEIDALYYQFGDNWQPLSSCLKKRPTPLFDKIAVNELQTILQMWQEALERTYYDEVLRGVVANRARPRIAAPPAKSFQGLFCIDDRECSFRQHLELLDNQCETFGTPGFFGVAFYFKPEHGKFYTKLCPAPVSPKHLIKEMGTSIKRKKDAHLSKQSHSLFPGWLITHTLGFWSAIRLMWNIFKPSMSPATATSLRHMDKTSKLSLRHEAAHHHENNLQIGFTATEMAQSVENLLRSIGLTHDFAPLVYVVGHGSSSVNNPHYAAYDCGACCGRPGSVNARVICAMANDLGVRKYLKSKGLHIPDDTHFVGALHDTTRDEIVFYDEENLVEKHKILHKKHVQTFEKALANNAKERSRRFTSIETRQSAAKIHQKILRRSVSLFEPRPELNHATNALCIVGRRELTNGLFLDRRAFLNSYDFEQDTEGDYLFGILKAAAPVCGGINLEYFFSRVDNQKLGAGTKLPHNVMGLIGVANGIDGDLRPGLPSQMIEVHDPIRLLVLVEHFPEVVLRTIQRDAATYEWFGNEWVRLVVLNPKTGKLMFFEQGQFIDYQLLDKPIPTIQHLENVLENAQGNFNMPVQLIQ